MVLPKDSPLFSELERIQQRIQDYSDSLPDVENPNAQELQSLSDRAGALETRDGAEKIGAHAELTRAQPGLEQIQAQAELIRAQAKKIGDVIEESKAKNQNQIQTEESKAKAKGDQDKHYSHCQSTPRKGVSEKSWIF